MEKNDFIIHACAINGDGHGSLLKGQAVSDTIKDKELAWIHMDATNPESRCWLESEVSYLDHIIINALLAEEARPRLIQFENGYLLILRGVNLNDNAEPEDMVSIRLWVDEHRIISLQRRNLKATKDIFDCLINGNGPKNSGDFIAMLTSRLFERMEPIFQELDERLDDIEEAVVDNPDISERQEISVIRKQTIMFRRYIAPQRDVLANLRGSDLTWIDTTHRRKFQESYDRVARYLEDLDTIRERGSIVKDELASVLSDRLNRNMYVLSLIAAIFLPLGFLTGLLGINIGGIPGSENHNAFWIFCGILSIISALQIIIFKKLKWL